MTDDERVLASFLEAEEPLRETWRIAGVTLGAAATPPPTNREVPVGLTDRRLVWYDEDRDEAFGAVALSAVSATERDAHDHRSAPRIVRGAGAALALGVLTSVALFVFELGALRAAAAPALLGVIAFLVALAYARWYELEATVRTYPFLRIDDGERDVTLWGPSAELDAIAAALGESAD